jgi:hypothetical protein
MRHSYLKRHTPLARGTRRLGRNAKRSRETFARNFGERGEAVRAMPCLCAKHSAAWYFNDLERHHAAGVPDAFEHDDPDRPRCEGDVQAAHVLARGMGGAKGDRRQLVPLCARHHDEAGEGSAKDEQPSKRAAFEALYGIVLKAEAQRIAVELDERGLA